MACENCGHTNQRVSDGTWFWCPRCGTLTERPALLGAVAAIHTPKLVLRCRKFARELSDEPGLMARWKTLGIAESIDPPENRG
jgi:hypothetical protein